VIGIFDSGLGGLSVVRRVRERWPQHDLLFFADQAHVPYGERTPDDLARLLRENIAWLNAAGVSSIVMGCNTSCAIAQQSGWPESEAPILDLIESAGIAVERSGAKRVGVVATTATVTSGAYTRTIQLRIPGVEVVEIAAPALVPLVEAGKAGTEEAHRAVKEICAQLPRNLDAVILACTHYPILDAHFEDALGGSVARIDPAIVHAERVQPGDEAGTGTTTYVTNADLELFRTAVHMITGEFSPSVRTAA
jgi:glutamate racemase